MSVRLRVPLACIVVGAFALAGLPRVPVVQAATFNVDTPLDLAHSTPLNGSCTPCSLRSAIQAANFLASNGDPGPHTINLPAGTFLLTLAGDATNQGTGGSGSLRVTGNVIINGAGTSSTIIDGNNAAAVFNVVGGSLTLNDATIRNGNANGASGPFFGGGVDVSPGSATLNRVLVTNNRASSSGGGISNTNGTLTLLNSTIANNQAPTGGALFHFATTGNSATLTMDNSTAANNTVTGSSSPGGLRLIAQGGTLTSRAMIRAF